MERLPGRIAGAGRCADRLLDPAGTPGTARQVLNRLVRAIPLAKTVAYLQKKF